MTIETNNITKIIFIKIENQSTENSEDKLLVNILQSQGWNYNNSTIHLSKVYKDTNDLISILKKMDVPKDGIEEILISSKIK